MSSVRETFSAEFEDDYFSDVSVMEEEGEEWAEESFTDAEEDDGSSDGEEMDDDEEEEEESSEEEEEEEDLDGLAPTPKRRKLAQAKGLSAALSSGLYPQFEGIKGPSQDLPPQENSAFDYLRLLWPVCLCELIATEMDRYAHQCGIGIGRVLVLQRFGNCNSHGHPQAASY